jgi:hypothetical protein
MAKRALLFVGFWTLLGLFFGVQAYLINTRVLGVPGSWPRALAFALLEWYCWAALAPLVVWLARRYPLGPAGWRRSLAVHLVAGPLVAIVQHAASVGATHPFKPGLGLPTYLDRLEINLAATFHWGLVVYAIIVSATLAADYYRSDRERELRASHLEARLAEARLDALRMQLEPHFLFNALNAVSGLMYTDVDAADRMLVRLGEFLRTRLEAGGEQEVTLREELEALERYVDIERARFEDRLTVRVDVAPETLDARVPTLLLQPLVENAIRHGVAPRTGPGRVEVWAARDRDEIALRVRDDGLGLSKAARPEEGIGLANTRARLEALHADAYRLELRGVEGGGLEVEVRFPFRTAGP